MGQFDPTSDVLSTESALGKPQALPSSPRLDRVVQGAHHTIDKVAERVTPQVQRLHDRADHVRQIGDEWVEDLRGTVRDRPLRSLATAALLGMVIARLMR